MYFMTVQMPLIQWTVRGCQAAVFHSLFLSVLVKCTLSFGNRLIQLLASVDSLSEALRQEIHFLSLAFFLPYNRLTFISLLNGKLFIPWFIYTNITRLYIFRGKECYCNIEEGPIFLLTYCKYVWDLSITGIRWKCIKRP